METAVEECSTLLVLWHLPAMQDDDDNIIRKMMMIAMTRMRTIKGGDLYDWLSTII